MNIASHNTFSYLPVRQWWLKPFAFMARCQRVDFGSQWLEGARLFDIRLRFDKKGTPIICHGLMKYSHDEKFLDNIFRYLDYGWFRIILETKRHKQFQEFKFREYCRYLTRTYKKLVFFGGNNRSDWSCEHPIHRFKAPLEDLDNKYASTTTLFPDGPRWLRFIDDLFPLLYAKRHNHKNRETGTTHKWLMLDFVDIQ